MRDVRLQASSQSFARDSTQTVNVRFDMLAVQEASINSCRYFWTSALEGSRLAAVLKLSMALGILSIRRICAPISR